MESFFKCFNKSFENVIKGTGNVWKFANPVRITVGENALDGLASLIGGRTYCLVTYDEPYFSGLAERITSFAGAPSGMIDNITPNPDFEILSQSCALFSELTDAPEIIVALGGGSVIDAAKVVAAAGGDFASIRRYLETGEEAGSSSAVPIIAVPTTAGTGSEVTSWAAVWDVVGERKYSLSRPDLYPEHAVVDPVLTLGVPRDLTISTALDALSHALESVWNRNANSISSHFAVCAAREILAHLPALADDLGSLELRRRMAEATLFAGLAFSNTKTALAHSLSYPITLARGIPHGIACSFSLPMVMRSVIGVDSDCDETLGRIFDGDPRAGADRLARFLVGLGVSVDPADYVADGKEWEELIDFALVDERGRNFIGSRQAISGFSPETGKKSSVG